MPRKNVRAKKRRLDRREKGMPKAPVRQPHMRVTLDQIIIPDGKCFFQSKKYGKAIYNTKEKAQAALDSAQRMRAWSGSSRVEKRFYKCPEGGCGGYHLTSREEYQERPR